MLPKSVLTDIRGRGVTDTTGPEDSELLVKQSQLIDRCLYLAPGARDVQDTLCDAGSEVMRIVCIADTHNEHESLCLPSGHILVHAGDCLTESGQRYVERSMDGKIIRVLPEGEDLFRRFAAWLAAQPFEFKVLVGGNHDLVLQGLGPVRCSEILAEVTQTGKAPIYLEHSSAMVGPLRFFGSPYAQYGGKNDAFFMHGGPNFSDMPKSCDVVVTHMPCVLPTRGEKFDENGALSKAMHHSGVVLHISGHCHWAHGVYHTRHNIPSVVASVSSSHWLPAHKLTAASGVRGDAADRSHGGYNTEQLPIVCDIAVRNS
jgi:hypothetical protein